MIIHSAYDSVKDLGGVFWGIQLKDCIIGYASTCLINSPEFSRRNKMRMSGEFMATECSSASLMVFNGAQMFQASLLLV